MKPFSPFLLRILLLTVIPFQFSAHAAVRIVVVAGETATVDKVGHHDYLGGCRMLADLLKQTAGVETSLVKDGWPTSQAVFDGAAAVVFYTDGGGKQAYLQSPDRIAVIQKLAVQGMGLSFFHQAVDYPEKFAQQAIDWTGGAYVQPRSGRGHWNTTHAQFPRHAVTRGVSSWEILDGWLNELQFVEGLKGVTPLVWSGKTHQGSSDGGIGDVVGWVYERPAGGRSFGFTGIDAHSAWALPGMRQLIVNGILWTANLEIPKGGAPNKITETVLNSYLTPR